MAEGRMKTIEDFLATLSPDEKAFVDYMNKATKRLKNLDGFILLNGRVIKTTMFIAALWQTHHPDAIRVARDKINGKELSTVFIPVRLHNNDHFESMCFGKKHSTVVGRYKTLDGAKKGHAAILQQMEAKHEPA
jgi:hypothetical protein